MTSREDWAWRSEYLFEQANYLERKARNLMDEAARYRGLAEQAAYLSRYIGDVAPIEPEKR